MDNLTGEIWGITPSELDLTASQWIGNVLIADKPTSDLHELCSRLGIYICKDIRLSQINMEPLRLGTALTFSRNDLPWIRIVLDERVTELSERLTMFGHEIGHVLLYSGFGLDLSNLAHRDESVESFCESFGIQLSQAVLSSIGSEQ